MCLTIVLVVRRSSGSTGLPLWQRAEMAQWPRAPQRTRARQVTEQCSRICSILFLVFVAASPSLLLCLSLRF